MRDEPSDIVEQLRHWAEFESIEYGEPKEACAGWDAADYVEWLTAALERIEAGESDPRAIARGALDANRWVRSLMPKADPTA